MQQVKLVMLGSGSVGKSAICIKFYSNQFVDRYDPTIEDIYRKTVSIDDHNYLLEILDTAGTETFLSMRDLYIKNAQGYFLVYSVTSRGTFEELNEIQEQTMRVREYNDPKEMPVILVANKSDLSSREISTEEGQALARSWGNCSYFETSAKTGTNIEEAFKELVRQVVLKDKCLGTEKKESKKRRKATCTIL